MTGNNAEITIQKNLIGFYKLLPDHKNSWKATLESLNAVIPGFVNLCEQFRHVDRARIEGTELEQFPDLKERLIAKVLNCIEDDMAVIQQHISKLSACNKQLREKLVSLESITTEVDFDYGDSDLICGTGIQPALSTLLQMGLESVTFYTTAFERIEKSLEAINYSKDDSLSNFSAAIDVNVHSNERINYIVAITQYFINE